MYRPWINVDGKALAENAIGVSITKSALTATFGFLVPVFPANERAYPPNLQLSS
jgi:hypothetical protein